jgi:hypothetical protein
MVKPGVRPAYFVGEDANRAIYDKRALQISLS